MTFANLPSVLDGALTSSALLRKAFYAAIGDEGVVGEGDLIVSANSPAGQSLLIAPGVGVVLNRYQTTPNEVYVAANPGIHTVTSGDMPGSSGGTTYWMVCLVVGDPQASFSQTGHPFMPADFDEEEADTYQYVRPVVIACDSGDTTFADLGLDFPGLALALLTIPASTTTITSGMITDLRHQVNTVLDTDWIEFTLPGGPSPGANWVYHGTGEKPAARVQDQTVKVKGLIKRTSGSSTTICTLPTGMRPTQTTIRLCSIHGGSGAGVTINTDGTVIAPAAYTTNNQYIALDFEFDLDQP